MELELNVCTSQKLTPQMVESIQLLQMTTIELSEFLQKKFEENPLLEFVPDSDNELQKQAWLDETPAQQRSGITDPEDQIQNPMERIASNEFDTLEEWLHAQITERSEPDDVKRAADYITENLDDSGYFCVPLDEISARLAISEATANEALRLVQSLNPVGVGARDLKECLLLQLRYSGEADPLAEEIVTHYLDELSHARHQKLAQLLQVKEDEVRAACSRIRSLEPHPGNGFSPSEQPVYVYPDFFVEQQGGDWKIHVEQKSVQRLRISNYYCELLSQSEDPDVRTYLGEKLIQAKWVIDSVERRNSILRACAEKLLERQKDYLCSREGSLCPFTQTELAALLGVSISTVSRAVRGKYIQCPRGVFPLSTLFTRSVSEKNREDVSAQRIEQRILFFVEHEPPESPYSDQQLSELLEKDGFHIARRTVAKYRTRLNLAGASERRRQASERMSNAGKR